MPEFRFSLTVRQPPEVVFGLVADLRGYDRWLPGSDTFTSVGTVSPGPIAAGTTYTDRGPRSTMRGEVTEYAPPHAIAFRQEVQVAPLPGRLTIRMQYRLREQGGETRVERTVSIHAESAHKLLQPILVITSRRESGRVMRSLERYLSGL